MVGTSSYFNTYTAPIYIKTYCVLYMFLQEKHEIEGKVDWKGKPASKEKHGGMKTALFVLGKRKN